MLVHIQTHTNTHPHTHTHPHIHTHPNTPTNKKIHTYTHTCTHAHTLTHPIPTNTQYTHPHSNTYARKQTYTPTHKHTHKVKGCYKKLINSTKNTFFAKLNEDIEGGKVLNWQAFKKIKRHKETKIQHDSYDNTTTLQHIRQYLTT